MMRSDLAVYLIGGVFLILLLRLPHWLWRIGKITPAVPKPPRRKRVPKPFAGLTRKPPPRMIFTRGRRRHVYTTSHFCPHTTCSYHGWVGWGNIRANGYPNGRRWRQLVCLSCRG